jgi:hypothetical protein
MPKKKVRKKETSVNVDKILKPDKKEKKKKNEI